MKIIDDHEQLISDNICNRAKIAPGQNDTFAPVVSRILEH